MARLKLDKSACPGLPRVTPGYLANSHKKFFSRRGKLARIFLKKSSPGVTWRGKITIFDQGNPRHSPSPLVMPRKMSPWKKNAVA